MVGFASSPSAGRRDGRRSLAVSAACLSAISVAAGSQNATPSLTCPPENFQTIENFNLDTYISDRWYIQQQMPVSYLPESQNRCVFAEYRKRTNKGLFGYEVAVHNYAEEVEAPHKPHDSGSTLCAKVDDASRGKLKVAPCRLPPLLAGPYWVVDYNEEKGYSLVSGGAPKKVGNGGCRTGSGINDSGLWILTRQQKRDEKLVQQVRSIAQSKGFDLSVLNDVDQSDCTKDPQPICPPADFKTVSNFDLDSFISKRWHIQQQQPVSYLPADQNRCVYAEYKKREKTGLWGYEVGVHNHAEEVAPPHKPHDSGSTLCAKIVDAASGKLEVAPCFLPSLLAGPYWVLAYNEEEGYALISGGAPKEESNGACKTGAGVNGSGLWIFTRQQKRDEALVNKVRDIAKAKGFDLGVLNDVDQSNCSKAEGTMAFASLMV
mmetsp:Transcript_18670/g.40018  ORF Transcript_18670/g.40018 Transcript_18670/m.40018 type:complete len:433 (-) Transcript_18670:380-1678(-)